MKKLLVIPLYFLYFLAVSGVMVQQSYCLANNQSVAHKMSAASCGGCCSKDNTLNSSNQEQHCITDVQKSCCEEHTVIVKTIHEQLLEKGLNQLQNEIQQADILQQPTVSFSFTEALKDSHIFSGSTKYPPKAKIPLYKLYERFLVYDCC